MTEKKKSWEDEVDEKIASLENRISELESRLGERFKSTDNEKDT